MKFLFVAPRFHTNQFPIVKSLIERGHNVEFFVQNVGKSEDHSKLKPYLMKKSILSILLCKIVDWKYSANEAESKKLYYFIPANISLFIRIRKYRPDVVILRERNFSSWCAYLICKILKIRCTIIYNQTPLYSPNTSENIIKRFIKKIIREFFPKVRITTVYARNISVLRNNQDKYHIKSHDYFVPFIAELKEETANRTYCKGGNINILDVGKYRDYKNHFLLVDAISLIGDRRNLRVTIVGQVVNEDEQKYFDLLKTYIKSKNVDDVIRLEKNIDYNKMDQIYQTNDIFILPSKLESASISILEAMANGMVTISTDNNGTASYINEGECGYLFRTMDAKDLAIKIEQIVSKKTNIYKMGNQAYLNIKYNYSFPNYYSALGEVLEKEFGVLIEE
ncbi:glycosyltransferase family 4 protein [Neobacillus sp. NPDC058068]|uniref:glycosyltransferase family 4 protein n=1 Tax=Neobacillus sp. NPDC058068 TaxID=3346325 RepID=UPI0036DCBCBC